MAGIVEHIFTREVSAKIYTWSMREEEEEDALVDIFYGI